MRATLTLAVVLVGAGCLQASPPAAVEQQTAFEPVTLPDGHPPMLPDPEENGGHTGRAPRRITVAQLRQSLVTTLGTQWSQLESRAASLGQADFAVTVSESTDPNLVFAKFLEDGAREVCLNTANADLTRPVAQRVLTADLPPVMANDFTALSDADVQRNLRTLSVRFWGMPMSEDELTSWTATFRKVATRAKAANRPREVWGTMCIAFLTDARFLTY